jgi:hypothetical protein
MAYAHFAPEYLQDAISLNPLRGSADVKCPHNVHSWVMCYGFQWSCVPRNPHCTVESRYIWDG